jgi:mannose-6-phosphate isomerase
MTQLATSPYRLGANQIPLYYKGGDRIAQFRGDAPGGGPEDWVGSVTAIPLELLPGEDDPTIGISRLPDGSLLSRAVADDPRGWLGDDLARAYGDIPGLLVKLLDAGERLPVHCHPTRALARQKLGSSFGKTEGWIVMDAAAGAEIWLGFRENVEPAQLRSWVDSQDVDGMLAAMNRLDVQAGEAYYVPAGIPHSIGEGVMITELQEPTSYSILAEYREFGLDEQQATLGLGWDEGLTCFDLSGYAGERLAQLKAPPAVVSDGPGGNIVKLFPADAEPFFQGIRARATGRLVLGEQGFRVLVFEHGSGSLTWATGEATVGAGETWVVPSGAGPLTLEGEAQVVVCCPPDVTGAV